MPRPPVTREPGDPENQAPLHLTLTALFPCPIMGRPVKFIRVSKMAQTLDVPWKDVTRMCRLMGVPIVRVNRSNAFPSEYFTALRQALEEERRNQG